jgi:molybdenum cofactor biosynthesis enzyme MoaA
MRDFSRLASAEFVAFKHFSEHALRAKPDLRRLDCLNPIKALKHEFDFSYVPEIDIKSAWQRFLNVRFNSCVFSLGVRDSLYDIFKLMKNANVAVDLPSDVYPVYEMVAKNVGLQHRRYSTLPSYNVETFQTDTALIAAPSVPSGKDLSVDDVKVLLAWLSISNRRLLIIDRVYDYNNSTVIQPLIDGGQTIVCYSLSKTFLSPLTMGMSIVPSRLESSLMKDLPIHIDKAKVLLTKYKDFPRQQQDIYGYRWNLLRSILDFAPPETGYLTVVPVNYKELLRDNILAIPGEVYGTSNDRSIITCLHETNACSDSVEVARFHVTVLSNFAKGYDKYSRTYSKENIPQSSFPHQFYLLGNGLEVGFAKARKLLQKTAKGDKVIVLRTNVRNYELHPNLRAGPGSFIKRNWIEIDTVLNEDLDEVQIEDAYADSLALNELRAWSELKPRSLSVLPIANACQAKCEFCFSHSSVSNDQKQGTLVLNKLDDACARSARAGAERLVITGGGEPTMLSHDKLLAIIRIGRTHFNKIVMITNGYKLGHTSNSDRLHVLRSYEESGLTVLSISRHSHDNNTKIMKLDTKSELIAETWKNSDSSLQLRWVCILQRHGVHDEATLAAYLDWVVSTGVKEICFKELYVAATSESVYHDGDYNKWCKQNQVALKLVLNFLIQRQAERIAELPWGSPIYLLKWKAQELRIAVYTEPSVFWERSNGVCRSWNLMADGTCYANLEAKDSEISLAVAGSFGEQAFISRR